MPTLTNENRRYLITYETLNAVTHGIGVLAAIVGATLLMINSVQHHFSAFTIVALAIYATSIISFFACIHIISCAYFYQSR